MFRRRLENLRDWSHRPLAHRQALMGDNFPGYDSSYSKKVPEESSTLEWTWDVASGNDFVDTLNDARDVMFHRKTSSGTAVVRGSQPMSHGQHFWEIEMISPVYGTDMMVGIGTAEADVSQLHNIFVSRLGQDDNTWGFSYTGSFYHKREEHTLSSRTFEQGSIIGLHLDLWKGTLSFYKDRKHLGVAVRGLKGKTLYAMASSTAACSSMRLLRTSSFPSSLQFLCCSRLRELIPGCKGVLSEIPDIPPGLKLILENSLGWLLDAQKADAQCSQCDDPVNYIRVGSHTVPFIFMNQNRFRNLVAANMRSPPTVPPILAIRASEVSDQKDLNEEDQEWKDLGVEECKRRRYSYNYVVGLDSESSDSDSSVPSDPEDLHY